MQNLTEIKETADNVIEFETAKCAIGWNATQGTYIKFTDSDGTTVRYVYLAAGNAALSVAASF